MAEKMFYTMGEVAEMFDVNASLIRYWGTQFPSLKPQRNKKGNRLFTPADIETLKRIYHYVKECGMTLDGAKKALRGGRAVATEDNGDMELLQRLHSLQNMLTAVRDSLDEEQSVQPEAPKVEEAKQEPQRPKYREQSLFDF